MGRLFDMDGGFMGALSKFADVVILSLIYVVFSIPLITVGASTTALYYTSVKCIRRGRSYVFRSFWQAFKGNFKKSTILWFAMMALTILFSINFKFANALNNNTGEVLYIIYVVLVIVGIFTGIYIFPVLSRFELPFRAILKNSLFMSIRHLPFTVLMVLILAGIGLLLYLMPISIMFAPAAGALLFSLPMEKILKIYTPKEAADGEDTWYLE